MKIPGDKPGRALYLGLLPAWGLPGLLDWWFHRRSRIEEPNHGGVRESLIHMLMLAEGGLPIGLALFAEINPLVLSLMTGAAVAHEATVTWDLRVATASEREVVPAEQQTHSFLEAIPFTLALLTALHASAPQARRPSRSTWRLHRRPTPLPPAYVASVLLAGTFLSVVPHVEELVRCAGAPIELAESDVGATVRFPASGAAPDRKGGRTLPVRVQSD